MKFDFSQLNGLFDNLKEKGTEYAGIAVGKTKDAARIAKLAVDIGTEKEALKRTFVELGKAYYEEHRGTADGLFAQLCEEVDAVNARIKDMQDEMDALKGTFKPDEAPDFESVVSADEENDIEVEIVEEPDEENK
ncbi:MAG: hypothetical protein IJH47_09560 [Oscillospiraceae bacterium]|nr:hypothetical protein [Oscillospiraceae bacterium]